MKHSFKAGIKAFHAVEPGWLLLKATNSVTNGRDWAKFSQKYQKQNQAGNDHCHRL